jgi:signal transduction histidine kinase
MSWRRDSDGGSPDPSAPSLTAIVTQRVLLAAALAVVLQVAICVAENLDEAYHASWYLRVEIERLAGRVASVQGQAAAARLPSHYAGQHGSAYAYRVWDETGRVVDGFNTALLGSISPIGDPAGPKPDSWQRLFNPERWFHVVGGRRLKVAGKDVWIEVATFGDPARRRYVGLMMDLLKDVVIPQVPTILLAAFLVIASVRYALRPLGGAAALVERMEPLREGLHVSTRGLPKEAASLANAVNRLLARIAVLIESQNLFIARAAHQLRTPLAIVMLELGKLKDNAARGIEADIARMGEMVDRLLDLARLETGRGNAIETVTLADVVADLLPQCEHLAAGKASQLVVGYDQPGSFAGDLVSVREAIRNLIVNAIVHTPGGSRIVVTCGPGAGVTVEDNGRGLDDRQLQTVFEPFARGATSAPGSGLGLTLVREVATLHGGSVEASRSKLGGALFRISFV